MTQPVSDTIPCPATCARCGSAECEADQATSQNAFVVACRDRELSNLHSHLRLTSRKLEACMETLARARDELDAVLESL